MWSDADQQYSQWALNPSAYQDVSHEQVDWAALAQQWIQMKDTCPPGQMPPAPPPPPLDVRPDVKSKDIDVEGGEAPMDMDREDTPIVSGTQTEGPPWGSWNWQQQQQQQQWGNWGWGGNATSGVPPPPPAAVIAKQAGALPIPGYGYTTGTPSFVPTAPGVFNYNAGTNAGPPSEYNQVMGLGGYWTSGQQGNNSGPAPFLRNNRQEWSKRNDRHDRNRSADKSDEEDDSMLSLDAAKRRQLPAWIREGLEKMEREKQKKIDRDRQIREREMYLQKKREDEEIAMNEMQNNNGQPMIPKKSKFESDSDESDHEDAPNSSTPANSTSKRKSRFRNADSPSSTPQRVITPDAEPPRSREEIMQETMLNVRRMLTEILLEVTTEEMLAVAQQVLTKAKAKAPALQVRKTPALASLTGKLGLGIYGDSDDEGEESEDSGDDFDDKRPLNGADSEEELKDQIQRRKSEFSKTEREIEARLREEEERENEEKRLIGEGSGGEESGGDERQVEHNNQSVKRPFQTDGVKIKVEPEENVRSMHHSDHLRHDDNPHSASKEYFTPPTIKKEIKCEHITGHRTDKKLAQQTTGFVHPEIKIKQEKLSSDELEEMSSKSDSESSSSSKSTSSSVKSSSSESRRSLKKSSKSSRKAKKSAGRSESKLKKLSVKSKDKRRESKELKAKDRKKIKRDLSRSPSKESRRSKRSPSKESRRSKRSPSKESRRSKRSHSKESRRSKRSLSKESRRYKRSPSKESRRSKRSPSKESRKYKRSPSKESRRSKHSPSKESRRSKHSASKESRRSRSKRSPSRENRRLKRSPSGESGVHHSSKHVARERTRDSRSPAGDRKRLRRESTMSRSSRSVSPGRRRSDKQERYSRSRSRSPRRKKSSRLERSVSSERWSRAKGKTSGR